VSLSAVCPDRAAKKAKHLGVHATEEEAARVYDKHVLMMQGLANKGLNFLDSECTTVHDSNACMGL
jgi:hypothetical protein